MAKKHRFARKLLPYRQFLPSAIIVVLVIITVCVQSLSAHQAKPAPTHTVAVAKKIVPAATKPPVTTPPKSTPAPPSPPPPPAPKPAPVKPALNINGTPPQPVVTPSPASNVSGLAPTTPSSPSGTDPSAGQSSSTTTTGYTSLNWSGYLSTAGTFTAISGSWHVPAATGQGTSTSADSSWIGIGGVTASDLIQTGTQNIISSSGQVSTSAFYEMLPDASIAIPSMTVSAGDSMSATITEVSSGRWTISITDNTNNQSFTTIVDYTSTHSSAEWIEEDPSSSFRRLIPFDNFHTVTFTGGTTTLGGSNVSISGSNALPVTMENRSGQTIASPSALSGSSGFTVTRQNAG